MSDKGDSDPEAQEEQFDPDATRSFARPLRPTDSRPSLIHYAAITFITIVVFLAAQHVFGTVGGGTTGQATTASGTNAAVVTNVPANCPEPAKPSKSMEAVAVECPACPVCEAKTSSAAPPALTFEQLSACDPGCAKCGPNASCYFGDCYCHPGFEGPKCDQKATHVPFSKFGNWWYKCPNVIAQKPFDMNDNSLDWGGATVLEGCPHNPQFCLMMCFYNEDSGIMQVPTTMWRGAQNAEASVWAGSHDTTDRGNEHVVAFGNYDAVPMDLGNTVEVGPGPWSQFRFMIAHLKEKGKSPNVKSITLMEPNGVGYILNTPTCSYKDGVLRDIGGTPLGYPLVMLFTGVEQLRYRHAFDTLMVMNVVEHVQDAYAFFQNIYHAIKPGGLIIFHERYFEDPYVANGVLGEHLLHPIRLRKKVLDRFTSGFEPIYFNDKPTPEMIQRRNSEIGYYFIGRKKKEELPDCCSNRN